MKKIEILAPAGSFDSVIAAVRSGADAVYLGEKAFSARSSAKNFDDEELKKATAYCHIHGVKVSPAYYEHKQRNGCLVHFSQAFGGDAGVSQHEGDDDSES